ncbi:MAG: alpha/beta hydrolase [bacterium]|nr:alpha/beta hydrolase [Candidatus Sumerlaeota bacterium]
MIYGENVSVTPVECGRLLAERIRNSPLVILPNAGHLSPLGYPDAANDAISES